VLHISNNLQSSAIWGCLRGIGQKHKNEYAAFQQKGRRKRDYIDEAVSKWTFGQHANGHRQHFIFLCNQSSYHDYFISKRGCGNSAELLEKREKRSVFL